MQNEAQSVAPSAPRGLKAAGIIGLLVAGGIVALGAISRADENGTAQQWSNAQSIPTVHLISAEPAAASDALILPGTMEAWNAAKLYARVGGYVKAWYRDIGAEVPAGTPLGVIDTPELDQQIVQARANLASSRASARLARSTADRWNDLLTTNSVSRQEADEKNGDLAAKNAAVEGAQANLGRLLAMKAFATIRAPFGGLVTLRSADVGDLVGPGATTQQPLFAIADVHRIRVYVSVPQTYAAAIRPGMAGTVTVPDQPGRTFAGLVVGNSGAINSQTGTFQVALVVDNPDKALKPGGYAQVRFDVASQRGTVQIPSSALIFRAQGTQAALIGPGDRVRLQPISLGRDLGGTVEVVSGLQPNQKIIDNPPDSIGQGQLVRIGQARHG